MAQSQGSDRPWRTMCRTTGIAGVAFFVLAAAAQTLVNVGGAEPAFDAATSEIVEFLETRDRTLFGTGMGLLTLSMVAFLWFITGLRVVLQQVEGGRGWRSLIALLSGLLFLSTIMVGGLGVSAVLRSSEGVNRELAHYAFDAGNFGLATAWLPLASFLAADGWIMLDSRSWPSWLGWLAVAAAAGFLISRVVWTSPLWYFPYAMFWVWAITVSIMLLRGRSAAVMRGDGPALDPKPAAGG